MNLHGLIKEKIMSNTFVDKVRIQMVIDEEEYDILRDLLNLLSLELRIEQVIDKELALILYSMPQMIRNAFLSFQYHNVQVTDLVSRLEDIWIELDELVIQCLS